MSIILTQERKTIPLINKSKPIINKTADTTGMLIATNNNKSAAIKSNKPSNLTNMVRLKSLLCLNNL